MTEMLRVDIGSTECPPQTLKIRDRHMDMGHRPPGLYSTYQRRSKGTSSKMEDQSFFQLDKEHRSPKQKNRTGRKSTGFLNQQSTVIRLVSTSANALVGLNGTLVEDKMRTFYLQQVSHLDPRRCKCQIQHKPDMKQLRVREKMHQEEEQWFPQLGQGALVTSAGGRAHFSLQKEVKLVRKLSLLTWKRSTYLVSYLQRREDHCLPILEVKHQIFHLIFLSLVEATDSQSGEAPEPSFSREGAQVPLL